MASQCSIFSFLQMEELELRKEIEAKRKREGKWVEPKLTPKQKEALAGTFFYKGFLRENAIKFIINKVSPDHISFAPILRFVRNSPIMYFLQDLLQALKLQVR